MTDAERIIRHLNLQPLPGEGGYFRRTWTGPQTPGGPAATAIYFLLSGDTFSAFHRLPADEIWHHYAGDAVEHWQLTGRDASARRALLGPALDSGQEPQLTVPAGTWQAARLAPGAIEKGWALLGCTLCPGWRDDMLELAERTELAGKYPAATELIGQLTRRSGVF